MFTGISLTKLFKPIRKVNRKNIILFLAILGPGIITANVDNDAGGVTTYSLAGAQFGYALLWVMIPTTVALVVIQDGDIAGIFSERDFARKSIAIPGFSMNTPIRSLMTSPVFYVLPDQTVEECMSLMTEKRIRHLPVLEENVLIGVISIGDVVRHLMVEKHAHIKDLESYIVKNS